MITVCWEVFEKFVNGIRIHHHLFMTYRYSPLQICAKKLYRKFFPVPRSPWTAGAVDDICTIHLVPPERLISFFSGCITMLQKLKGPEIGDYLEFGVFNGSSIGSMHIARAEYKAASQMRLFGFDAFEGLPEHAENEDAGVWKKSFYACSFERMQECLSRRNVPPNDMTWVKGWYNKTLNAETAQAHKIDNIGIAFIDCDTYSSSKSVLDFLSPLIKSPAILCFDDWKLNDLDIKNMGEYKAFNEFADQNKNLQIEEIKSYNRKSKSFLVIPRRS
ncbi:MAG: hypothetical protein GC136_05020 [Alphaproteobacteria bacterium]|nr:hypothetical protein [Alphaproteobacteria bacterium]